MKNLKVAAMSLYHKQDEFFSIHCYKHSKMVCSSKSAASQKYLMLVYNILKNSFSMDLNIGQILSFTFLLDMASVQFRRVPAPYLIAVISISVRQINNDG